MTFGHGGNIYEDARQYKCRPSDIIDMTSNINPLGPPPGLLDFLNDNLSNITRIFCEKQRLQFHDMFKSSPNIKLYPGRTPFILAKLAHQVRRQLANELLLIRNCDNFQGLSDQFFKISLKTPETNRLMGAKLKALPKDATMNCATERIAC